MFVVRCNDKSSMFTQPFQAVAMRDHARDPTVIITQVVPPNLTFNRITVYIPSLMSKRYRHDRQREADSPVNAEA